MIKSTANASAVSNLPDDVNAMASDKNAFWVMIITLLVLGDGNCLIYARDAIDVVDVVDTHGNKVKVGDLTSSNHVGVCEHNGCHDEVFTACPTCLSFLCFDHKDSTCEVHILAVYLKLILMHHQRLGNILLLLWMILVPQVQNLKHLL